MRGLSGTERKSMELALILSETEGPLEGRDFSIKAGPESPASEDSALKNPALENACRSLCEDPRLLYAIIIYDITIDMRYPKQPDIAVISRNIRRERLREGRHYSRYSGTYRR